MMESYYEIQLCKVHTHVVFLHQTLYHTLNKQIIQSIREQRQEPAGVSICVCVISICSVSTNVCSSHSSLVSVCVGHHSAALTPLKVKVLSAESSNGSLASQQPMRCVCRLH